MNITKKNNIFSDLTGIIVFLIFCIGIIFVSFFHEPWFDELQALGIAKDSLYNILFVVPHFEAHPPFWHLILKAFSFLDTDLCLKLPNILIMASAIWLLIFKSPFPKILKYSLPFTFFLFYQYAIISRPYSLFCLSLFIVALLYKKRNDNPYIFIIPLIFLSLSCFYGMLFAIGIVITWILESKIKIRTSSSLAICIFFLICLLLICLILPTKGVYALSQSVQMDYITRFAYSFFGLIADSTIYDFLNYQNKWTFYVDFGNYINALNSSFGYYASKYWICCFLGMCIHVLLFIVLKFYKKRLLFYLPFSLFSIFACFVYLNPHHIGLITLLLIFVFWCIYSEEHPSIFGWRRIFLSIFLILFISVQIYWSVSSSFYEVKKHYSPVKKMVSSIKKYNLQNYKIFSQWTFEERFLDEKGKYSVDAEISGKAGEKNIYTNSKFQYLSVLVNQYFSQNIIANFDVDKTNKVYVPHTSLTEEENNKEFEKWKKIGTPDVLLWDSVLFIDNQKDYIPFITIENGFIWKGLYYPKTNIIYLQKDFYKSIVID